MRDRSDCMLGCETQAYSDMRGPSISKTARKTQTPSSSTYYLTALPRKDVFVFTGPESFVIELGRRAAYRTGTAGTAACQPPRFSETVHRTSENDTNKSADPSDGRGKIRSDDTTSSSHCHAEWAITIQGLSILKKIFMQGSVLDVGAIIGNRKR